MKRFLVLAIVVAVCSAVPSAQADTVNLASAADAKMINTDYVNTNFGSDGDWGLAVYNFNGLRQWSVLKFDLSGLPSGANISNAVLKLTIGHADETGAYLTEATNVGVYRSTQGWTESGVTWNMYDGANSWTNAGGDAVGTTGVQLTSPYATASVSDTTAVGTVFSFSSANMTELVKGWAAGTTANHGFELASTDTGSQYDAYFASKEHATASYRPVLEVTYAVPEPMSLVMLGPCVLGLLAYAWRKRR